MGGSHFCESLNEDLSKTGNLVSEGGGGQKISQIGMMSLMDDPQSRNTSFPFFTKVVRKHFYNWPTIEHINVVLRNFGNTLQ